ncbi:MAG: caspase family protein [Patescibacteria group bacterium]
MKKALVLGIDYIGTEDRLYGCINDASSMANMLTKRGYEVVLLTDNTDPKPFKDVILAELEKLVTSDSNRLFFSYAGHGVQTVGNAAESDGMTENLYSLDLKFISDDEILQILKKMRPSQTLIAVVDACHSGTVFDLQYNLVPEQAIRTERNSIVLDSDVILLSAAIDSQTSEEINGAGVFTRAFLATIVGSNYNVSPSFLIDDILRQVKMYQTPQISASKTELLVNSLNI